MFEPTGLSVFDVETVTPVLVGGGCTRRDLCSPAGVRIWIVDMEAGTEWTHVDHHEDGENVFLVSGEMFEGQDRYGPESYLNFEPVSNYRPRTGCGGRLFGLNLAVQPAAA